MRSAKIPATTEGIPYNTKSHCQLERPARPPIDPMIQPDMGPPRMVEIGTDVTNKETICAPRLAGNQ
jgi:hypothetical protein